MVYRVRTRKDEAGQALDPEISTYQSQTPHKCENAKTSATAGPIAMTHAPFESPRRVDLDSRKAKDPAQRGARYAPNSRGAGGDDAENSWKMMGNFKGVTVVG